MSKDERQLLRKISGQDCKTHEIGQLSSQVTTPPIFDAMYLTGDYNQFPDEIHEKYSQR